MKTMNDVAINVVTTFKGAQNLDTAHKKLSVLDSAVGKLGKTLGAVFATQKIIEFGKASVEAFANDQKAAAILAQTLKNVGQGFRDAGVEDFITKTSLATGVLKNDLRTGFDTLIRSTKDATEAQKLLNLSLDISAGTGKDLSAVTTAVGKSYLGQNTALGRLGVGLTSAQLKGKTFIEIQTQLNSLFKNDAAVAADSYAGKLKRVGAAWEEAKVTIGSGLADAFSTLAKDGSFDGFVKGLESAATYIANMIRGLGDLVAMIKKLPGMGIVTNVLKFAFKTSGLGALADMGAKDKKAKDEAARLQTTLTGGSGARTMTTLTQAKAVTVLTAAQIKALAVAKDQLKIDTASALLKKSQAVFDMQAIQIAAAQQNSKLTADEQLRLSMMATQDQLQSAIQDKNIPAIDQLTKQLQGLQAIFDQLAKTNAFDAATQGALALQSAVYGLNAALQATRTTNGLGGSYDLSNYASTPLPGAMAAQSATSVQVTISADPGLVATVQQGIVNNTASGTPAVYSRSSTARVGDW